MSSNVPVDEPEPEQQDLRAEAQRWVRRKRLFYAILVIYVVLSLMWFAIDMADGTENLWFYWPMLGTGLGVAITAVVLFGIGGLFGAGWERRQVDRYLQRHGGTDTTA
jgi:polyferredoxin